MLIYTCEQMRVIEENADVNGLSYVEMMENAGNACAEKIHSTIVGLNSAAKTVAVLCGSGKNGGDGFVIAKNLSDKGYGIRLVLTNGYPTAYESKIMYAYLEDKPVLVSDLKQNYDACVSACMSAAAVVDCVFGIGFHGRLDETTSKFLMIYQGQEPKSLPSISRADLRVTAARLNQTFSRQTILLR